MEPKRFLHDVIEALCSTQSMYCCFKEPGNQFVDQKNQSITLQAVLISKEPFSNPKKTYEAQNGYFFLKRISSAEPKMRQITI